MIINVNGAYEPQLSRQFLEVAYDSGTRLKKVSLQPKDKFCWKAEREAESVVRYCRYLGRYQKIPNYVRNWRHFFCMRLVLQKCRQWKSFFGQLETDPKGYFGWSLRIQFLLTLVSTLEFTLSSWLRMGLRFLVLIPRSKIFYAWVDKSIFFKCKKGKKSYPETYWHIPVGIPCSQEERCPKDGHPL